MKKALFFILLCAAPAGAQNLINLGPTGHIQVQGVLPLPYGGTGSPTGNLGNNSNIIDISTQAGSDWCAMVNNADSALGANGGKIVIAYTALTSAVSSCSANITLSANHILEIDQAGTYALTSHSILLNGSSGITTPFALQGSATASGVIFSYSGSSYVISPATPTALTFDVTLRGFTLSGTSSAAGGINMRAANSWSVQDVAQIGFSGAGALGIYIHSDAAGEQGSYWNNLDRIYFSNADTCIKLAGDVAADWPNANHFGFVNCNANTNGVNLDGTGETAFEYLAINMPQTCTYAYRDHGIYNYVKNGRVEMGGGGGSCQGLLYDAHDGTNFNGILNRFVGTVAGFPNLIQTILSGPSTVNGSPYNQVDLVGGQGTITLQNNAGQGGSAIGIPATPFFFTMAAAQTIAGSASALERTYLGSSGSNYMQWCTRNASVDTCNAKLDGAGNFNITGTMTAGAATASTLASTVATGTPPLTVTSTTPVANLIANPLLMNSSGGSQGGTPHMVLGFNSLSVGGTYTVNLTGAAVFFSNSSYQVFTQDISGAYAVQVTPVSASQFTLTGTASHGISWIAIGI